MTLMQLTRVKIEEILRHPSAHESATFGGQHYLLIEGTLNRRYAKALVAHLHKLGYGARVNSNPAHIASRETYAAGIGGRTAYYVYVRRRKR